VDVRIIAATNRQLESEIAEGRFREDLYYRLSVVPIPLPPLRERPDDIPVLVGHFLQKNQKAGLGHVRGITPAAMALLKRHDWPGNIRQLEMVLKNVSLFCDAEELDVIDFQSFPDITRGDASRSGLPTLSGRSLADIERAAIIQALQDNRGNKKKSAEMLGIDRRTLYNKLKAYNIVIEKELHVT
jgi:DNA-binding NtrC family response regulator